MAAVPFYESKFLDGEMIFKRYAYLGRAASFSILRKWLIGQGVRNPVTNQPPCRMAIWNSMWRWALANPDVAKKYYDEYLVQFGEYMSDSEWTEFLKSRARNLYSPSRYERYKNDNGLE